MLPFREDDQNLKTLEGSLNVLDMGKVKASHVAIFAVSLCVPTGLYLVLLNRRLQRRIPLVSGDNLPNYIASPRSLQVQDKPNLNYVEAYFVDLPAAKFTKQTGMTKVEDFARTFFTTLPMRAEWSVLSFLQYLGIKPFHDISDTETKENPPFTKGKPLMDGTFRVEKGVEVNQPKEIRFSYWFSPTFRQISTLSGGVHSFLCEPLDPKTIRVWFVTYFSLGDPSVVFAADPQPRVSSWTKYLGTDPRIINPNDNRESTFPTSFNISLWFHRLYSRILLDFAARGISMRK